MSMASAAWLSVFLLALFASSGFADPSSSSSVAAGWSSAQATVYAEGSEGTTNGGACGYGVLYDNRYGSNTAAISSALFEGGAGCGACFELRCDTSAPGGHQYCKAGDAASVVVTATNFCPPSTSSEGPHWCNSPYKHFDLSESAYRQITTYSYAAAAASSSSKGGSVGLVPILYKRVPCTRQGGMRFTINGHGQFNQVLLTNVGGNGQVKSLLIKGSKTGWQPMVRNWGSNWQLASSDLRGQPLSFQVVLTDSTVVTSYDVAPAEWRFGQTFQGRQAP